MTNANFPSVSVGFPVYNEEATINEVLREAHELLSKSGLDYEIIICNDGSTDRSSEIIEDFARQFPNIRLINHPRNLGIHASFERLNKEARNDLVFINASDRQWNTSILLDMLPLIERGDIIIASRKQKHYSPLRKLISWGFNKINFMLFGVHTFDAGAVKLMKREVIEKTPIISKSPFSEAERLIRASKAGYRIINHPVDVSPRKTGHSRGVRFSVILAALRDVLKVWYSINFKGE